jgi:cytochrome d ubiquinol oxidase subunit I
VVQGLDSVPADQRPTDREVNVVHLAWDVMVGLGTLLFLFTLWFWASVFLRRRMPRSRWFLGGASVCGFLAVVALEAGWTVSEVGRQPWIVYNVMRVEDAATTNSGVWVTFIGVAVLFLALGVSLVLVLRAMSRRFRSQEAREAEEGFDDTDSPYGPRQPAPTAQVPSR